jgi:2'-5' RNA ligase
MGRDRGSRPEARPWRLFVAVDVPERVRAKLAADLEPLREDHPELRWAPVESWHVTLKFLGAVWPWLVGDVRSSLEGVASSNAPFETYLDGVNAFPSPRRAKVVWVGLADARERFVALARALDVALARIVKAEERPFTAHLTVARAREPVQIEDDLSALRDVGSHAFTVDGVVLYRSHLRRPAPVYQAIDAFALDGRAGR